MENYKKLTVSQCASSDYCKGYNAAIDDMMSKAMLPVICISERPGLPGQIVVGSKYVIDRMSIYIDIEGDAYGTVYDECNHRIADLRLSHFRRL